jgi:hypothetical protein
MPNKSVLASRSIQLSGGFLIEKIEKFLQLIGYLLKDLWDETVPWLYAVLIVALSLLILSMAI